MNDIVTAGPDVGLDWTDQVRAVARFISDHELPLISIDAVPVPTPHRDDCHVHIHISERDWLTWWPRFERIVDEHSETPQHCPGAIFHYVVGLVAGVRVQLVYLTDVESAVA